MIRILHLFDDRAGWQERVGASQLCTRLSAERFDCRGAVTDGRMRRSVLPPERRVDLWPRSFGFDFLAAPATSRYLHQRGIELVHAWGIDAAVAAAIGATSQGAPIVVELFDPVVSDRDAKKLRSIQHSPGFAVACSTQTIQRRLVEKGVAPEVCAVIRPGIDFAAINAARGPQLRQRLDLNPADRVLITPEPASRRNGQYPAFWAAGVRSLLEPHLRLIVPGRSREQARIVRIADRVGMPNLLCCPGDGFHFEDLIAVADAMLVPSSGEVPTTAIAWAMAAGVPVLATAVYATAEMMADKHNGLLVKPGHPKRAALRLVARLDDREQLNVIKETARGQAFQIFGLSRYVDQHVRLYENVLHGHKPAEGIVDSSLDL